MWFLFSLITALCWGGSDLFSKMGTNPRDKYSHWRLVIAVGTVMGLHAIAYLLITGIEYDPVNIIRYFPISFLYILSMTIGYAGLRYIELSISSPICNSSGAVTTLLCFFVLGQTMTSLQLVAVIMICLGVFLLSWQEKREDDETRRIHNHLIDRKYQVGFLAIILPILYCIIDGLGTFADAYVLDEMAYFTEAEANLSYEFTFLICAILAFIYLVGIRKQRFVLKEEGTKGLAAVCETAGQFFYVFAIADNAIVAAPLISSYSIFSVLLSRIFLKEKLPRRKYLVVILVLLGIALLGLAEELAA